MPTARARAGRRLIYMWGRGGALFVWWDADEWTSAARSRASGASVRWGESVSVPSERAWRASRYSRMACAREMRLRARQARAHAVELWAICPGGVVRGLLWGAAARRRRRRGGPRV